jgi:hypothetical protein
VLMDALTIASSEVVPDTAGFPHGSPGLADVIDPVADIEEVAINQPHLPCASATRNRPFSIELKS